MDKMVKLLWYSFFDMVRSKWTIFYVLFFLITTFSLLYLSGDVSQAIASLMNIVITIIPLISIMLGTMYYYNSREFIELLLAQPVKREFVFIGKYLGLSLSLSLSYVIGVGVPFLIYGIQVSPEIWNFSVLIVAGVLLTFIFVALAYWISIANIDKIKGFGLTILVWLFLAVIYDGLFLLLLTTFHEYPLEKVAITLSLFNPIDLSRILIMLKLDIAALLGYTGAVFNKFFGTAFGIVVSLALMMAWVVIPFFGFILTCRKKDF